MPLSAIEQAFAEAAIIEGLVAGQKLAFALKLKEAQKKNLPQVLVDLKLILPDDAKRLWKISEAGLKAAPAPAFTFSEGAMMGPYELIEPRGAFLAGTHWRAKRPEGMGFLRLVPPGTGLDQDRAQRLIDRANAGVDPPDETILRVDDAGEEFNWLYIGSLGFDGRSLASRLVRGPLPEAEALVLAKVVTRALTVAHGFGVVHAGLSTLAVVYGADGAPKLTDFGVGSVFFDGHPAGMPPGLRLGLLLYAAPELIRGGHEHGLDARADLFALGSLLADAVTGLAPGAVKAQDDEPWIVVPPVSDGLLTVLRRLMSFELDERYPSSDALLQDLERLSQGGLPGPLPPPGPPLVVAGRPESARPISIVTSELLTAPVADPPNAPPQPQDAAPDSQPSDPGNGSAEDAGAGDADADREGADEADDTDEAEDETDTDQATADREMLSAPPTVDPDAEPTARGWKTSRHDALAGGEAPPTDDPDSDAPSKPKKIRRPSQRLGRASSAEIEAMKSRKDHGLVGLVVALVVVVGGGFGAKAATAPDGVSRAKIELARAHLFMVKDGDFKKAQDAIALAREAAPADAGVAAQTLALEHSLRERRTTAYFEARRKGSWATEAPRLVEGTELDCLRELDAAKRDSAGDAKVWQKIGYDCLRAGFAAEAAEALGVAAKKDSSYNKDHQLGLRASELGAFVPAGTYPNTTLKKSLYVGAHEVTRDEYAKWLDEITKSSAPHARCSPKEPPGKNHAPEGWDPVVAIAMRDRRPATGIDYWDALACAKGMGGRLPTAPELKAAATGLAARPHPWGEHAFHPSLANGGDTYDKHLLPVASLFGGASPTGAYDLLGNAEEWCTPEGEDDGKAPIFGGDATTPLDKLGLATEPGSASLTERTPLRGFRVALEVE